MATYKFVAEDPRGQIRRGKLEAADESTARATLTSQGLRPIELSVAAPSLRLRPTIQGSRPREIKPESKLALGGRADDLVVASRLSARLARARRWATSGTDASLVVVGGLLLGCLWVLTRWLAPAAPARETWGSLQAVRFHCLGNLSLPSASSDPKDVSLVLELPPSSFRKTYTWAELSHPAPRQLDCSVDLKLNQIPSHFVLHLIKPGYKEAVSGPWPVPSPEGTVILGVLKIR